MNILSINGTPLTGIYVDAAVSFNKPSKRVTTFSVPGRNGDLVIDEGTFDNVLISYPVYEKSTFPQEFDDIVNWLASLEGYQKIQCSNDPQHYRLGRFVVPVSPTAKRLNKDGYYTLTFDCKPQRWLLSGEEDTEIDQNPIDEYSGALISFNAVALDEITELKVAIEPVQSLNGQTSPYPAGGGKNLLDYTNIRSVATNVGIQCDASGNISDSSPTGDSRAYGYSACDWQISLAAGTYTVSWYVSTAPTNSNANLQIYQADGTNLYNGGGPTALSVGTHSKVITLSAATSIGIMCKIYDGKYKIQIESGSTPTAYAPYSNICPISGHTEVNVTRTGVNVWDEEWEVGAIVNGADVASTSTIRSKNYCGCKPSTTYYIKSPSTIFISWYDANKAFIERSSGISNATITSPSNACYFRIGGSSNYGNTYNNDISINYPSTDTDYHAYAGQTYPISLGQTVYGGTLNVTTGVLTIDRAEMTLDGTEAAWGSPTQGSSYVQFPFWLSSTIGKPSTTSINSTFPLISLEERGTKTGLVSYEADNGYRFALKTDMGISTAEQWKTWLSSNPVQLCYELATPVVYDLTGEELERLVGHNNIFANCGQSTVVITEPTYFVNPGYFASKPIIRVYGDGTFRVGDNIITIAAHTQPYIDIDSELQDCYYEDTNMNAYVTFGTGEYPVLVPGQNYILMGSGITKLIITPRWWEL